ncbi:hypothetical protein J6590_031909 [Homalodisca vitripennis]|nr:hypothetical protein J6590_031909 [Homalodisca vitripennis]
MENQATSSVTADWMGTTERSCPCKQPACPAVGGGSEVTLKPLVPRLSGPQSDIIGDSVEHLLAEMALEDGISKQCTRNCDIIISTRQIKQVIRQILCLQSVIDDGMFERIIGIRAFAIVGCYKKYDTTFRKLKSTLFFSNEMIHEELHEVQFGQYEPKRCHCTETKSTNYTSQPH